MIAAVDGDRESAPAVDGVLTALETLAHRDTTIYPNA
jgi:hypothetical protein